MKWPNGGRREFNSTSFQSDIIAAVIGAEADVPSTGTIVSFIPSKVQTRKLCPRAEISDRKKKKHGRRLALEERGLVAIIRTRVATALGVE